MYVCVFLSNFLLLSEFILMAKGALTVRLSRFAFLTYWLPNQKCGFNIKFLLCYCSFFGKCYVIIVESLFIVLAAHMAGWKVRTFLIRLFDLLLVLLLLIWNYNLHFKVMWPGSVSAVTFDDLLRLMAIGDPGFISSEVTYPVMSYCRGDFPPWE